MKFTNGFGLLNWRQGVSAGLIARLVLFGGLAVFIVSALETDGLSVYAQVNKAEKPGGGKKPSGKTGKPVEASAGRGIRTDERNEETNATEEAKREKADPDRLAKEASVAETPTGDGSFNVFLYLSILLAVACAAMALVAQQALQWKRRGKKPQVIDTDENFLAEIKNESKTIIQEMSESLQQEQKQEFKDLKQSLKQDRKKHGKGLSDAYQQVKNALTEFELGRKQESGEFKKSLAHFQDERKQEADEFKKSFAGLKDNQEKALGEFVKLIGENFQHTQAEFATIEKKLTGPLDQVSGLVKDTQKEVERYQDGYDYAVLSAFIGGIIDVLEAIKVMEKAGGENDDLDAMKVKLQSLLKNQKVKEFNPAKGEFLSEHGSKVKVVSVVSAGEGEDAERIKEVTRSGYEIVLGPNERKVLRRAEVIAVRPVAEESEAREEKKAGMKVQEEKSDLEEVEGSEVGEEEGPKPPPENSESGKKVKEEKSAAEESGGGEVGEEKGPKLPPENLESGK